MGPCTQCSHFRKVRPASQLLAAVIKNATSGAEIDGALGKIGDDEQKLREAEADVKGKEGSADRNLWPSRPMMAEYCGLQEDDEIFYIAEVKNRGQLCEDFERGMPARHACADCANRVPAEGRARDQRMEATYHRMINSAVLVKADPPRDLLQSHRGGAVARKALEISAAYASKGWMLSRPEYFDYCSHFSTEDEYVVCALRNPYNTCARWITVGEERLTAQRENS